jgi:hypothetical protein
VILYWLVPLLLTTVLIAAPAVWAGAGAGFGATNAAISSPST